MAYVSQGDDVVAISRLRPRWGVLNETAAAIVRSCARPGGSSVAEVEEEFRSRFGPVDRVDLEHWLDELQASGILDLEEPSAEPSAVPDFGSYSVEHAYIELLARCNLRCLHCFMGGAPERDEHLELDEVLALLNDLHRTGGRYVTLSGGEPLLYPGFESVARRVSDLGLYGTVITNGTVLRDRSLELVSELGFNLAISLDGITPEVNERIRGRGTAAAINSIDRAMAAMGPDRVILSFTPVKANLSELPRLFEFVRERGIRRVNLSIYEEVGRAAEYSDLLSLSEDDRLELVRSAYRQAVALRGQTEIDLNDTRNILDQFAPGRRPEELHPLWRGVRVTSSGDVFPSSFGAVEQYRLGNIRATPFAELLRSPVLRELYGTLRGREAKIPKCRSCAWNQICRGGSVAAAYCATGDLLSPDPYCEAFREVFPEVAVDLAELAGSTS